MRDLLIRLAKRGKSLLVTSHILSELSRICDRVAILTHGKLRAFGTVAEISGMVSQQRTIEAQLSSAEQIATAVSLIRPAIEPDAEIVESAAESAIRFRTAASEDQLSELLASLVRGGVRVAQFGELQTDLEEAFLSFTSPSEPPQPATPCATLAATGGR